MVPDAPKGGYVVLQRFMVDGMSLSGDELIVYAIIYGFCQDGRSACRCSRNYFAYWLGKSKTTVNRVIDSLVEKGYVVRAHEVVDGQTTPRYLLGAGAPRVKIDHDPARGEGCAHGKGGTPTYPPYHGEADVSPVGTGGTPTYPRYADEPPVRGRGPITDTDTETDTESDGAASPQRTLLEDFNALKCCMPTTDGYSYGYENYRKLRERGLTAEEIAEAAKSMTRALRRDYPDRPARYFPHAERLLDPDNPQGICGYLDHKRAAAMREPTDRDLFLFALTASSRDDNTFAAGINEAFMRSSTTEERDGARARRDAWLSENRERLAAGWRERRGV